MSLEPADLGLVFQAGALGLVLLGLVGMLMGRELLRVLLGLTLLESGVNLFIVSVGYRPDRVAPILVEGVGGPMVDPLPQALILTSIVIGVGVLALGLGLAVRIHRRYGTLTMRALAAEVAEPGAGAGGGRALPAPEEGAP